MGLDYTAEHKAIQTIGQPYEDTETQRKDRNAIFYRLKLKGYSINQIAFSEFNEERLSPQQIHRIIKQEHERRGSDLIDHVGGEPADEKEFS